MFSRIARDKQKETETLFAYFHLVTPRSNACWIKYDLLEKRKIDINLIKNVLDRLDVRYDDSDATIFKVLISQAEFAAILDDAYPSDGKESANSSSSQAKNTTAESKVSAIISSVAESKNVLPTTNQSSVVQADPITARCQSILSNCQTKNRNGERPLFTDEAQQTMLMNYVRQALNSLDVKREDETKNQFDTRILRYRAQQNNLKKQFKEQFASSVRCDEHGEPEIFFEIQKELKQVEKQNKVQLIQSVFLYTVEHLNGLQDSQLQVIYNKAQIALQQLDATKNVIETLCERGGVARNTVGIQMRIKSSSSIAGLGIFLSNLVGGNSNSEDPLQQLEVILTAPNEAIAYSIYNMLVVANIYPNQPFQGNPSKRYDEPMTFTLSYEQFSTLQRDLSDLTKWYRDFENILSALFAADAAEYVKTGCKPLREAVRTEVGRERSNLTPLINRDVRERFNQHPNDLFLLFGQCAVDLTSHPDREQMRDLMQRIYTLCNLKDSKNEQKTFVKDEADNLTFISLLNVMHIREIYNEIMALSELSKSAKEMGFSSVFAYVELVGVGDIKLFYHSYLQQMLQDICMANTLNQPSETQTNKRRRIETLVNALFPPPRASVPESFSDIQKRFHTAIEEYLNKTVDIILHRAVARADLTPTEQEKTVLLVAPGQRTQTNVAFQITNDTQLAYTVNKLKASPKYRVLSEAYTAYYQSLGAQPRVANTSNYNRQFIYMYPTLDECLDKLYSEFERRGRHGDQLTYAKQAWLNTVMKIVYAEKMQIPATALKRAAERFADIFKVEEGRDDLGAGCGTGLTGRCLFIESQLIPGDDNVFMQFNRQLLIDNVEQSFNDTIASIQYGESSMAARVKPDIMEYVGLSPNTTGQNGRGISLTPFMSDLATRYNPGNIYSACYTYLCDEFKRCARENDYDGMEVLLTSLHYSMELDVESLQIDGKWNIKCFEVFLPQKLIQLLRERNIIHINQGASGNLVIEATNQRYSFAQMIAQKQQRLRPSTNNANNRNSLFGASSHTNNGSTGGHVQTVQLNRTNVSSNTATASAWSVGGLFGRQEQPTPRQSQTNNNNAMSVNLGGDSNRSTQPNTGSTS